MRTIALADVPATPWRNGRGLTRLLASGLVAGPGASSDAAAFDWRLSVADISADGPFSSFPGVDRHAVLLGKGTVMLSGPSASVCAMPLQPVSFPGETEFHAQRRPGSSQPRFLNLMVRRGVLRGELRVIDRHCRVDAALAWALLPVTGRWQVQGSGLLCPGQVGLHTDSDVDAVAVQAQPLEAGSAAVLVCIHSI